MTTSPGFTRDQMKKIVQAAGQAPSGDNVQPWRFESTDCGQTLLAYVDGSKDESDLNVGMIPTLTAIGAALENARLAAAGFFGRTFDWEPVDEKLRPGESTLVARFSMGEPLADDEVGPYRTLVEAVFERHTHRLPYDSKPLDSAEHRLWEQAQAEVNRNLPGASVKLIVDPDTLAEIRILLTISTPLILDVPAFQTHVFDNIRFPKKGEPLPPDGMPVDTLGVGRLDKLAVRLLKNRSIAALAMRLGAGKKMGQADHALAKTASAFGMILARSTSIQDLLRGGAAMQKMWLACTVAGLKVQPMTSPMLHTWLSRMQDMKVYSDQQRERVNEIAKRFTALHADRPTSMPVMIFRMGHAAPIEARCGRRPVEDILTYSEASAEVALNR